MIAYRQSVKIIGASIDVVTWERVLYQISIWSERHESRYVCICNVHSVVTAYQQESLAQVIDEADIATPDGAPLAWMLRRMRYHDQERINGPDLMLRYCEQAQYRNESIFFYGSTEETLSALKLKLLDAFPSLKIAGAISPPFRPLTDDEDAAMVEQINGSGAGLVWVSLGCPKQELWMAAHKGRINAVMVGVGAAFDYHAGTIKRAPVWMQDAGFEWLHRLFAEPRRLWKRYLFTNTIFIFRATLQLLRYKFQTIFLK